MLLLISMTVLALDLGFLFVMGCSATGLQICAEVRKSPCKQGALLQELQCLSLASVQGIKSHHTDQGGEANRSRELMW